MFNLNEDMRIDIIPFHSAGPFRFGMTREEARAAIAETPISFRKSPMSPTLTDAFDGIGVHVYYAPDDTVEALEFYPPADPVIASQSLLNCSMDDMAVILKRLRADGVANDSGLVAPSLGIAVYASSGGRVEGVLVFRKGYYDE